MKFGIRVPSLKRRIAARTSWKRYMRHSMGLKVPRGMGWLTNPKRAVYSRIYNRTSIGVDRFFRSSARRGKGKGAGGCGCLLAIIVILVIIGALAK